MFVFLLLSVGLVIGYFKGVQQRKQESEREENPSLEQAVSSQSVQVKIKDVAVAGGLEVLGGDGLLLLGLLLGELLPLLLLLIAEEVRKWSSGSPMNSRLRRR